VRLCGMKMCRFFVCGMMRKWVLGFWGICIWTSFLKKTREVSTVRQVLARSPNPSMSIQSDNKGQTVSPLRRGTLTKLPEPTNNFESQNWSYSFLIGKNIGPGGCVPNQAAVIVLNPRQQYLRSLVDPRL
jgi:hypothetical protein